jgi:hypothetical protein
MWLNWRLWVTSEGVIELVYELQEISKSEPIPLDQVHIISKDESIEAINEPIQLKEELKKYRLSTRISIQT